MLATEDLSVSYGGVHALEGVSLEVAAGSLVGLIGPNGAGKTTFIDAVTGFAPSTGSVLLDGRALDGLRPHRRARLGLVRTFQQVELFDDLDGRGNLLVAAQQWVWWTTALDVVRPGRRSASSVPPAVERAVGILGIEDLLDLPVGRLSEGGRKLVGIARALAHEPRVLLLDEPAAGLDSEESQVLGIALRRVVDAGVAVLLVDHDLDLVMAVCDLLHVLDTGRLIASGPPDEVRQDEQVIRAYLGTGASA